MMVSTSPRTNGPDIASGMPICDIALTVDSSIGAMWCNASSRGIPNAPHMSDANPVQPASKPQAMTAAA